MSLWACNRLRLGRSEAAAGAWTPVPRVVCVGPAGSIFQAGWLVAPAYVVTAAHGVLLPTQGGAAWVEAVYLDFGSACVWAECVAVPQAYWHTPGAERRWDMAVLRLAEPLGEVGAALSLTPLPPRWQGAASLWGYAAGNLGALPVQVHSGDGMQLRYPAVNLPGDSGGPLVIPAGSLQGGQVVGMHVGFDVPAHQGCAVRVPAAALATAMEAMAGADATGVSA